MVYYDSGQQHQVKVRARRTPKQTLTTGEEAGPLLLHIQP